MLHDNLGLQLKKYFYDRLEEFRSRIHDPICQLYYMRSTHPGFSPTDVGFSGNLWI